MSARIRVVISLLILAFTTATLPESGHAQGVKGRLMKTALCGGAGWLGFNIGEKLGNHAVSRMKLSGDEARKVQLGFKIGTAAAACATSVVLAGTIYDGMSKRDREARDREMRAALEDANPGTRTYVLPDSKMTGTLETLEAEQVDDKECRIQLDTVGGASDPVSARWCRKNPNQKYDVDLGV